MDALIAITITMAGIIVMFSVAVIWTLSDILEELREIKKKLK